MSLNWSLLKEQGCVGRGEVLMTGRAANPLITQFASILPAMFDAARDAVLVYSRRGRIIYTNEALRALWKSDLTECDQIDPFLDLIMAGCRCDRGKLLRIFRPVRLTRYERSIRFELEDSVWLDCFSRPLIHDSRWAAQLLRFVDISSQVDLERKLQEKSYQFERMADCLPEPVFEIDLNGDLIYANDVAYEKLGYTREESSFNAFSIIAPEDIDRARQNVQRVLAGERLQGVEYQVMRRDGTRFPAIIHSRNILKDGRPIGLTGIILDQTEKKQADEALRVSEATLRSIFDNSLQAFLLLDRMMLIRTINKTARTWIKSRFDIHLQTGQSLLNYLAPGHRPMFLDIFSKVMNGESMRMIQAAPELNGDKRWIEVGISPVIEDDGSVKGVCISLLDITDQKKAELEVIESQDRFRAMVQNSTDIITILDETALVQFVSPSITRILGYSESEMVGRQTFDFVHPDDIPSVMPAFRLLASTPGIVFAPEFRFRHADGRWIILESVGNNLIHDASIRGIVINSRDITERKRTELALAMEKERLRVTLQSIADGVISIGVDLDVRLMNRVAESLTGMSREEAIGRPINDILTLIDEKTRQRENIPELLATPAPPPDRGRQQVLVSRDGSERLIEKSIAPILREDGTLDGRVLVLRDITLRRKSEDEQFKAAKMESIGILAGGIAHDFNNIMTGIVGSVYIAKMLAGKDDRVRKVLVDAERAALRAKDLTHQLITFSKGSDPVKQAVSIRDIIQNSATFILRNPRVKWEADIPDDLWAVEADENQICQVIHNLLINAEQAMPNGGRITIRCLNVPGSIMTGLPATAPHYVRIAISDQGDGIPDAIRDRIFDPYFTTKKGGSGLGLTTSFSIVKRHQGFLTFDSDNGGTTFHVHLPASPDQKPVRRITEPEIYRGSGRILVMDDDDIIINVTSDALTMLGYQVTSARNGDIAIDNYRESMHAGNPFSAVILDLVIADGMGGEECIRELRRIDPDIVAIVTSGYSNDPILINYGDYGFKAVLPKPFNAEQLSALLYRLLVPQKST